MFSAFCKNASKDYFSLVTWFPGLKDENQEALTPSTKHSHLWAEVTVTCKNILKVTCFF